MSVQFMLKEMMRVIGILALMLGRKLELVLDVSQRHMLKYHLEKMEYQHEYKRMLEFVEVLKHGLLELMFLKEPTLIQENN